VVIGLSGHGSDTHELVTYDADLWNLQATGLPLAELTDLVSAIPARQLVVIDRRTVSNILHRHGVQMRRRGLSPQPSRRRRPPLQRRLVAGTGRRTPQRRPHHRPHQSTGTRHPNPRYPRTTTILNTRTSVRTERFRPPGQPTLAGRSALVGRKQVHSPSVRVIRVIVRVEFAEDLRFIVTATCAGHGHWGAPGWLSRVAQQAGRSPAGGTQNMGNIDI
jgi:hypothetical protein